MSNIRVLLYCAFVVTVFASSGCSHAEDSACDVVSAANAKLLQTPYHSYFSMHVQVPAQGLMHDLAPGLGMDKMAGETIFAGGVLYDQSFNGHWQRSKITAENKAELAREQQNQTDVVRTCRYVRDETIDGQSAAVYEVQSKSKQLQLDATSHVWISKSSGLPLRERAELDKNTTTDNRYEYLNVQAPAGVQ